MSSTILEIKVVSCIDIYEICNSRGPDASRAQTAGDYEYSTVGAGCLQIYSLCSGCAGEKLVTFSCF